MINSTTSEHTSYVTSYDPNANYLDFKDNDALVKSLDILENMRQHLYNSGHSEVAESYRVACDCLRYFVSKNNML